jgi:hypothetical protein
MCEMGVRQGTGKVLKFFRIDKEPMSALQKEIEELTDKDFNELVAGLTDETLTY